MHTQVIWQCLSEQQIFSVALISNLTNVDSKQVRNAINRWVGLGYIKQANKRQRNKLYKVVSDESPRIGQGNHSSKQPKKRNTRQQIWNTLKFLNRVNLIDILMTTDSGKSNARDYLNALERCGYVKGIRQKNELKVWVFINNTGHGAPAHIRGKGMFDKNLEQLISYQAP